VDRIVGDSSRFGVTPQEVTSKSIEQGTGSSRGGAAFAA
jgi:hypothetical protein